MVPARRRARYPATRVLVDDRNPGAHRLPAGRDLRAMVLLLSKFAGDAGDSGASIWTLGPGRRVCLLSHRIHHDLAAVRVAERILAGGLHRRRLSRRSPGLAQTAPIPSDLTDR